MVLEATTMAHMNVRPKLGTFPAGLACVGYTTTDRLTRVQAMVGRPLRSEQEKTSAGHDAHQQRPSRTAQYETLSNRPSSQGIDSTDRSWFRQCLAVLA